MTNEEMMMEFERKLDQVKRIEAILGNKNTTTCNDCNFQYIAMNSILDHLCPNCQKEELAELGIDID